MSRLARPFAALFALWFAFVLGDPGMLLHVCPMHSAHGGAATATDLAAPDHGAHMMHGGTPTATTAGEQAPQPDSSAPCTCIEHCSAGYAAAPITAAEVLIATAAPRALLATRPELPSRDVPASPDVRLPFANAPPQA